MNLDQYQNLLEYLESDTLSPDLMDNEQRTIINQSRRYEVKNKLLYKKNRKDPDKPIRLIKWTEVEPILYMMHSHPTAKYLETDAMYYKISEQYYWDQMYRDVQNYVRSCEICQKRGKSKRKEPLHPIQVGRAFEHVGIDLVGPLSITPRNNHYIIVATDYLTR